MPSSTSSDQRTFTNYVAYRDPNALGEPRIGHLFLDASLIQPLSFSSGTPISNLYQVIEIGESQIMPFGDTIPLSSVQLLPPISGRDVLAVGKNYFEHAVEFNTSGYDSSDKVDQPTHPVIFTKRATSIIAHGDTIYPHHEFTQTLDYEGEIGVIVGKGGFRISEEAAMDHVWGYTIINDVTARERQRDHKQFYIGKSGDAFCPMGPIAVPATYLPKTLRVQTSVNGEKRQDSTSGDLIFSVPILIKTLSEGTTLQPGDVIATGTPAGVGFGQKPPVFLKPGDNIEISVTGLGTLRNVVGDGSENGTATSTPISHIPVSNLSKTCGGVGLTSLGSKKLYYHQCGKAGASPIIFIHGLGGSSENFKPLISKLNLSRHYSLHLLDLEGHGLSPTSATSVISISSYAADVYALAEHARIRQATIIAHSMGCLVAFSLAIQHPEIVSKLILLGPTPSPLSPSDRTIRLERATSVRKSGMGPVADSAAETRMSLKTKSENLLAITAVRMCLLGQDHEGYAKGCMALANETEALPIHGIKAKTLIVTGDEDVVSSPGVCEDYGSKIPDSRIEILPQTGHWHVFEDLVGVVNAIGPYLSE
ncbi:fumarylacetoacetate hydrolase-like protein [Mollisia scopiformis]|uniref:Fumarylacetoacetate hydrolase-like protein n=1 Tax=Mollisia scopiformis TaxID=149040 RepID=A0A132B2Z2_MOLSC|nr:fumarylacetoacetate hydrolase-like protein [Mollisia scopiformis]KUJ06409.1 fumarylacetoacetate hydrolase-like protein [Mollisia scopiformis]